MLSSQLCLVGIPWYDKASRCFLAIQSSRNFAIFQLCPGTAVQDSRSGRRALASVQWQLAQLAALAPKPSESRQKADDLFSNAELDTRVLIPTCQGGIYLSITKQQTTKGAEVSANSKFLLGRSCHLHHLREMSEDLTWEGASAAVTSTLVVDVCQESGDGGHGMCWTVAHLAIWLIWSFYSVTRK